MIYENVELHNVAEVTEQTGGARLQRVPEAVRTQLNARAQERMLYSHGCEIRFVHEGPSCEVTLACHPTESRDQVSVVVFHGEYQHPLRFIVGAEPQTLTIDFPERLDQADAGSVCDTPFHHRVVRLRLHGGQTVFHGARGDGLRPPRPDELPDRRLIAYGTSITMGANATGAHLTYTAIAARALGMDVVNLGAGGSAHCEHALADYIAGRDDWHAAVLSLSVNMLGFTLQEFAERVTYMVHTVAGADPSRPVACITLWPFYGDCTFGGELWSIDGRRAEQYRQTLREAVESCPHPNARLLEGPAMMTDTGGLTGDLVHPGDLGMIEMGHNLAAAMRPLVD